MAFRFRKSLTLIPGVRVNLSRSGPSVSLGGKGFTYNIGGKGSRVSVGVPGSGVSWSQYLPHTKRAGQHPSIINPPFVPQKNVDGLTPIESAPPDEINARSTSEIAPILSAAQGRVRLSPFVCVIALTVFAVGWTVREPKLTGATAVFVILAITIAVSLDRYRRSVRVDYGFDSSADKIANAIQQVFSDLKTCSAVWSVSAQGSTTDWKRNAGATTLNTRQKANPDFGRPSCMRGAVAFASLELGKDKLFFLPDAALLVRKNSVAALPYKDITVASRVVRFIEAEGAPQDSEVVEQTWQFVNKQGGPDRRFRSNAQLPICQRRDGLSI